jgi:3-hydroxyisobutyrate dehydrogenase-like beta-hydroxyacid dehydrogenase
MGSGMAASLLKAGHEVIVYNRTGAKAEPLIAQGARAVASIADACRESAVITMLANDNAVEGVVLGKGGIIDSLPKGGIHISSSTISVALSEALAKAHAKAGQRFVAAPVFGRPDVAAVGQLFVITAGPADAIAAATPLFDAIGQKTFVVSETPKAANLVKLSGNFLIAVVIESLGEAMALVGKGGVGRHQYLDILTSTLFSALIYPRRLVYSCQLIENLKSNLFYHELTAVEKPKQAWMIDGGNSRSQPNKSSGPQPSSVARAAHPPSRKRPQSCSTRA